MASDNITITQGTQSAIAADDVSSVWYQRVKLDIGADGTASPFLGTISAVTNVAGGTIEAIRLDHPEAWGTTIVATASVVGTLKPLASGSAIYLTDIEISTNAANTVTVGNGTTTDAATLMKGYFAANGGLVSNMVTPRRTTAGSALVYGVGAGTISITASGYIV